MNRRQRLSQPLSNDGKASTSSQQPATLYECVLSHIRSTPLRHGFSFRTYMWLIDLNGLPALPWWLRPFAGFAAQDHLGKPNVSIRSNVDDFLVTHGIDLTGGRVLMLAHARVLGYVFNPVTLYWCRYANETPAGVIAEVHNTYGERHCYLLLPNSHDRACVDKQLYVSPFYPVDGEYRLYLPEPDDQLRVTISLHRDGDRPFVATLRGVARPYRIGTLVRAVMRYPLSTLAVTAGIRRHGARLYLRGLRVHPRPAGGNP